MGENLERLNELFNRKSIIKVGSGEEIKKQLHEDGKLTARERILKLLDDNSFVENGAFVKGRYKENTHCDGVITGYGNVFGRLVFVYAQDSTVLNGSVGEMHAKKICEIYDKALKMGAPVIGLIDSCGARKSEGLEALSVYGEIFKAMTSASGIIPQIIAVMGECGGSTSIITGLSDFIFIVSDKSKIYMDNLENSKTDSNMVHFISKNEESCISEMRKLIDIIPSNNMEDAPFFGTGDDISRVDEFLNTIVPENDEDTVDMEKIIRTIADNGEFIEVQKHFSDEIKEGFIRINGYTAGVVANNSYDITYHGNDKALKFISFCDAFNIPIITFTDAAGYNEKSSHTAIIKSTAKLIALFANATCPKINIIVRKAFGNPYLLMNSKHIGADIVFAWPTANVSFDKSNSEGLYFAAEKGYIDDIIEPAYTRKYIADVLEMLSMKREGKPSRKHSAFTI